MPIIFQKKIKRQKNLIFVLIMVLLIGGLVFWYVNREKEEPEEEGILRQQRFKKIEINFSIFENPFLKENQPLEKIPKLEGEVGRENPFLP